MNDRGTMPFPMVGDIITNTSKKGYVEVLEIDTGRIRVRQVDTEDEVITEDWHPLSDWYKTLDDAETKLKRKE